MYEVSQLVVYGVHGVCRIAGTEERVVDRRSVTYFVLEPLHQPETRFYLPSQNPAALAKIRPLMDAAALQALLTRSISQNDWIADENRRKQYYRQLISSLDAGALICMVRCLYLRRQEQLSVGRRLHQCDDNFLRDAERVLSGEISLVLGIPEKEVPDYLQRVLIEES